MAKIRANDRIRYSKPDLRLFIGTCSNCRIKKTEVIKVKNAQVCTSKCLYGSISA